MTEVTTKENPVRKIHVLHLGNLHCRAMAWISRSFYNNGEEPLAMQFYELMDSWHPSVDFLNGLQKEDEVIILGVRIRTPAKTIPELAERVETLFIAEGRSTVVEEYTRKVDLEAFGVQLLPIAENESAALALHKYAFVNKEVPNIIRYIDDRNLWKKEIEETNYFIEGAKFYRLKNNWDQWDDLFNGSDHLATLINTGKLIYQSTKRLARAHVLRKGVVSVITENRVTTAYFNETSNNPSDSLDIVLELFDEVDIVMSFSVTSYQKVKVELRSRKGSDINVGAIAAAKGGGGHVHASGYIVPQDAFFTKVLIPMNRIAETLVCDSRMARMKQKKAEEPAS